ncbi:hypothetical protein PSAC2689_100147 [Paraburkholderia sacchari]
MSVKTSNFVARADDRKPRPHYLNEALNGEYVMYNSRSGSSANSPLRMLIAVDHSEASLCAARFACELVQHPSNSFNNYQAAGTGAAA